VFNSGLPLWRFQSHTLDEIVALVDERLAKNRAAGPKKRS
jgi:hypothetical protein